MFFIGMIVGMHVGYTIRVIMRSDNPALYDDHKGIKKMLSMLTFPAWISIFFWGFANSSLSDFCTTWHMEFIEK